MRRGDSSNAVWSGGSCSIARQQGHQQQQQQQQLQQLSVPTGERAALTDAASRAAAAAAAAAPCKHQHGVMPGPTTHWHSHQAGHEMVPLHALLSVHVVIAVFVGG